MAKPSLESMMRATEAPALPAGPGVDPPVVSRKVVAFTEARGTRTTPEIERVTLYIPKAAYRFVKQTALDHDMKAHDVLMEGVDLVLAKYGKRLKDFEPL
jgi:hypothetical protein